MNCGCGKPLHYRSPQNQARVQAIVDQLGECVSVTCPEGTWMVPRHYIAAHGLTARELPLLAEIYGWEKK